MKKKLIVMLITVLGLLSLMVPSVEAAKQSFKFEVYANSFPATSTIGTKTDYANYGAVTPTSGLNGTFYATFRIRGIAGDYATNYTDVWYNNTTRDLYYLPGKGTYNYQYVLYSSLDSGQGVNSAQLFGRWEP